MSDDTGTRSDVRYSPILTLALGIAKLARWLTLQWYLHWLYPNLRDRADIPQCDVVDDNATRRRARAIDTYVLGWVLAEIIALLFVALRPPFAALVALEVVVGSRLIDLVRATVNTTVLDLVSGREDDKVASRARLVLLSITNYLELILCFGVIYGANLDSLAATSQASAPVTVLDALYFSLITQLTISFGDPVPHGWLRPVAGTQGLLGLLFIALVIGRTVSAMRGFTEVGEKQPPDQPV